MMLRFLPLVGGILSLLGCATPNAPIKTGAGKLTQERVDAIIEKCGGPKGMAEIKDNQLVIFPAKDALITGCVLKTLQATGDTTLSSVGNQRYDVPAKPEAR